MLATDWSFGSVLGAMVVFFLWIMAIWLFIALFSDIFRRDDLSGGAKAGWIILLFILPFLGALIYIVARPKMTAQDKRSSSSNRRYSVGSPATRRPKKWRSSRSCGTAGRSPPRSTRTSRAKR